MHVLTHSSWTAYDMAGRTLDQALLLTPSDCLLILVFMPSTTTGNG